MVSSLANNILSINKAPSTDVSFYLYHPIERYKSDSYSYKLRNFSRVSAPDDCQILQINIRPETIYLFE